MKKKIVGIIVIVLIVVVIISLAGLFLTKSNLLSSILPFQNKPQVIGSMAQGKASVSCGKNKVCIANNGTMEIKQVSGQTLEYLQHQCDNPINCPTPMPSQIIAATAAIRAYTKDSTINVTPLRTSPSLGYTYYCSASNHCWAVDANNKVIATIDNAPTIAPHSIAHWKKN